MTPCPGLRSSGSMDIVMGRSRIEDSEIAMAISGSAVAAGNAAEQDNLRRAGPHQQRGENGHHQRKAHILRQRSDPDQRKTDDPRRQCQGIPGPAREQALAISWRVLGHGGTDESKGDRDRRLCPSWPRGIAHGYGKSREALPVSPNRAPDDCLGALDAAMETCHAV